MAVSSNREAAGATGATSLASLLSLHLFCLWHFALAKDKMASQVLPLYLVLCLGTLGHFLMLQRYPWVNQLLIQPSNLPKFLPSLLLGLWMVHIMENMASYLLPWTPPPCSPDLHLRPEHTCYVAGAFTLLGSHLPWVSHLPLRTHLHGSLTMPHQPPAG